MTRPHPLVVVLHEANAELEWAELTVNITPAVLENRTTRMWL
jgi:hypothetical protein